MHLYEKLRQPEFGKRRNERSLRLLLDRGELDIARPFPNWRLPEDPTWEEDPYKDDTWGLYYHSLGWLAILDHGIENAPSPTQRQACAERLRYLLFSYLRFIVMTDDERSPKMAWFDHATAWRASAISYFIERRFKDGLTPAESELVDNAVRMHESKLRGYVDSGRWNANNHGLFHAEALWDMAQVFESVSPDTREVALGHMRTVLSTMIDLDEGVCREQSIYYHLFDAWLLAESAKYMREFGIEVVPDYTRVLRKMVRFYEDFAGKGEVLHAVGDTQHGRKRASGMLDEVLDVIGREDADREEDAGFVGFREYPKNGYYMFRRDGGPESPSGDAFAILLDKPFVGAHGHHDGGSFSIDYAGRNLIIDSGGPFAYGKELRFSYFKAAEAHNVLLFGKKSRPYKTQVTARTRARNGDAVRLRSIDLDGIEWQRTFVALNSGIFVIVDQVVQQADQDCHAVFHLAPDVTSTRLEPGRFGLSFGDGQTAEILLVSNVNLDCRIGGGDSGFPRGLVTRELGKFEPAPVISAGFSGRNAWIATVISSGSTEKVMVHALYSGKLVRIMLPGESPTLLDCNLSEPSAAVRIHAYRDYRPSRDTDA